MTSVEPSSSSTLTTPNSDSDFETSQSLENTNVPIPMTDPSMTDWMSAGPAPPTVASVISEAGPDNPETPPPSQELERTCTICMSTISSSISSVNCPSDDNSNHHGFHTECMKTWLLTDSRCPCCRLDWATLLAHATHMNNNIQHEQQHSTWHQ